MVSNLHAQLREVYDRYLQLRDKDEEPGNDLTNDEEHDLLWEFLALAENPPADGMPSPIKQHFRGVVWPRNPVGDGYPYVIVGMVVTNQPLPEFEGCKGQDWQVVLDGASGRLAECLVGIRQVPSRFSGDANHVLYSLQDHLVPPEYDLVAEQEDEDDG